ncbi:putative 1-phosphatidylinositol-3-phosphate 5-kinase FAB1C [Hordeum vulgare subsp. vulgare]|uniref:1-phosphatidylinositol-3-phosphate 5-kinase n=1 Tax=Hordeum vulgare subsp. vulgare TaxID=112509 RepID=A0A8I7B913_HORVV|nr:putative 1-phosphatidylinositol-3-phosphate 5-kinase FAB1C [Hordeum vulgare subsp. vulgare]XP_044947114.1 putative 1-phosphatidylinositol-3-phosphate 5-kinase FAB1C [Hordeum vulgare subsp. vulgare]
MGVLDFAAMGAPEKARSLVADYPQRHMHKGGADGDALARIETRRRRSVGHGGGPPGRPNSPASPAEPPTTPLRAPEARSRSKSDVAPGSPPPDRDIRQADDEEAHEPRVQFLAPGTYFLNDFSDTDSSVSVSNSTYRSMTPSPTESPTCAARQNDASDNGAIAAIDSDDPHDLADVSIAENSRPSHGPSSIFDFGDNIWCPPPPEDEIDDAESRLFGFDDDDDEIGDSNDTFAPNCFSAKTNRVTAASDINCESHQESVQKDLFRHFQALVAQLLKAEGVVLASEKDSKIWLDIVSSLAWQAAYFVKPDTKKGGSMDPSDYVKIKCIASGNPTDSNFVRGIVCSKNVKHKRMVSEYSNAKLLILGGALEYQKASNKLASIGTILEQEKEYLRTVVGKIESRKPNVLIVEKSVSSYAQELLAKDISLVLNVKRTLLERISKCTGGQIASSIDNIASARLGQCDMFKVEKVLESFASGHAEKRPTTKTLMFFEGCLKRLGCTVLLRGNCREELKKIKHAMQLAVFAAYHLSLETSFLADEGATIPRVLSLTAMGAQQAWTNTGHVSAKSADRDTTDTLRAAEEKCLHTAAIVQMFDGISASPPSLRLDGESLRSAPECTESESPVNHDNFLNAVNACQKAVLAQIPVNLCQLENSGNGLPPDDFQAGDLDNQNRLSCSYLPGTDNHQSILVSLSSTCIPKNLACERSHLFRIKFYGSFDKPLGRYLRENLFDQAYCCPSCKEPSESHARCYMHQNGSLTISVRRLLSQKLPGEHDGRIWMWHRCMKCEFEDGMPPATHRVVMSDSAWGLSFGKFLELSFSNHATANRVASCGHSLQRDCLRFYGYGNMVAAFHYSPMVTRSVNLPPLELNFNCHGMQDWVKGETLMVFDEMESLHMEVYGFLNSIERSIITLDEPVKTGIRKQIVEMKDLLNRERNEYEGLLLPVIKGSVHSMKSTIDTLELNRVRRGLLLDAYVWDCRLCNIDSLKANGHIARADSSNPENLQATSIKEDKSELLTTVTQHGETHVGSTTYRRCSSGSPRRSLLSREASMDNGNILVETNLPIELVDGVSGAGDLDVVFSKFSVCENGQRLPMNSIETVPVERLPSLASILSDKIDMLWSGSTEAHCSLPQDLIKADGKGSFSLLGNPSYKKAISPVRVHSFDSIFRLHEREQSGLLPASLHLSLKMRSVDSFRDLTSLVKDPMTNMRRAFSQISPRSRGNLNVILTRAPTYLKSPSHMVSDGARLLLPHIGSEGAIVVAVYDDEPTSIVSYAMTSQEYVEHVTHKLDSKSSFQHMSNCSAVSNNGPEKALPSQEGAHFKYSFDDEAFCADNTKFSVTCYFARQFASLRKKCCPSDVDYIRSLSRCKRWSADGGKSNVYFAKTMDERFIIKQVTKTELDSFVGFAPHYFRHLTQSLTSGSPTCLAKILGIYQVNIKGLKGGREVKMDLMVMENIFFQKTISRVYDLKGSVRSRYNSDTTSHNKVLLDSNLIEELHTKPIFLGHKAKRTLERAVWNDTSVLASLDVMDYSLLVGIDDEKNELVIGIIDFLRQYTWDKQLETWVKASGILGGPKNETPTVISPVQYKKRFRKAMSRYFIAVPDQWSS